jgi:hypothetical protein
VVPLGCEEAGDTAMSEKSYDFEFNVEDLNTEELVDTIRQLADAWIKNKTERVKSEDYCLDPRIGYIHKTDKAIIVPIKQKSTIDYYGGFEYIDKDHVVQVGDWIFYLLNSPVTGERCDIVARTIGMTEEEETE